MSEWQPIETAPKDGTTIIVPISGNVCCYWCRDPERWVLNSPLHMEHVDPIQWRPEIRAKAVHAAPEQK